MTTRTSEPCTRKTVISLELKRALEDANGLRNRLVHRYNVLEDKIAFHSINDLLPTFTEFVKVMEKWLKKKM